MQSFLLQMVKQLLLNGIQKNVFQMFGNKWRTVVVLIIFLYIITPTMEYLEGQRIKLMSHPVYSPDWSPCDFCLFPKIKEQLRGKNFQDINELHAAVQEQMKSLQKEGFD